MALRPCVRTLHPKSQRHRLTPQVVNFIQQPLPDVGPFPLAGAAGTDGQAGALGMGQQASTGLVQFNQFFSYVMPMVGEFLEPMLGVRDFGC